MSGRRPDPLAQVSDFEIRLLRIFRAVVECGGFSAAESLLGIGRSAISQQMSDLEQRLGLRLCQRGRAGFALTEEGREVYQSALQLLGALESFRTEVNGLHRHLRGELNIGLTDNLVTLPHMRITHALSGRDYQPLYDERSLLYCAVGHPLFYVDDQQLPDTRLETQDAVAPTFRLPPAIQAHYQALNCTASASDREGMAFLILTGRYIGYLPDHYASLLVQQGRLRPLKPATRFYDISLASVTRKGRRPHLVLESFLEALAEG